MLKLVFLALFVLWSRGQSCDVVILMDGQQLRGTTLTNSDGRLINAYLGIPYGKIVQRFAEAVPAEPWTGVLDASKDAPACLQYPVQFHRPFEIFGQEDCLTLNVYTPQTMEYEIHPWPVLVFFHGGGFVEGQAAMHLYGPQRLLNQNIVLVLMNYRVGALGFLSTGDAASSGNYGLLDQNLALRWIQENIAAFGGDPSRVTISGESAGGASVIYHLLSPLSRGLFHSAIHQSGSAICRWARQPNGLEVARNIAAHPLVGCPTDDNMQMVECLRHVDAMAIVNVTAKIGPESVPVTCGPVIEDPRFGKFLTEDPLMLLSEGRFNKVPVMTAVAEDEATTLFVFLGFIDGSDNYTTSEAAVDGYIGAVSGGVDAIKNKIKERYMEGANYSDPSSIRLRQFQIGSDAYFKSCSDMTAKLLVQHGVPVYFYVFDFASPSTAISNYTGHPDVGHGIILRYLFNMTAWGPYPMEENDQVVSEKLVNYWTNFAHLQRPCANPTAWPPTPISPLIYMQVGVDNHLMENYQEDTNKFWQQIFYPKITTFT